MRNDKRDEYQKRPSQMGRIHVWNTQKSLLSLLCCILNTEKKNWNNNGWSAAQSCDWKCKSYDSKLKIFTLFQRYLPFGFIYYLFHIDIRFLEIQCKIFFDRIFCGCCLDRFSLFTLMVCIFVYSVFSDLQFPIDLSNVAKDHPFLENDPLQSLYRRLVALNRCATMRLDSAHKHGTNVSIPYTHIKKSKRTKIVWKWFIEHRAHWKSIVSVE